MNDKRQLEE